MLRQRLRPLYLRPVRLRAGALLQGVEGVARAAGTENRERPGRCMSSRRPATASFAKFRSPDEIRYGRWREGTSPGFTRATRSEEFQQPASAPHPHPRSPIHLRPRHPATEIISFRSPGETLRKPPAAQGEAEFATLRAREVSCRPIRLSAPMIDGQAVAQALSIFALPASTANRASVSMPGSFFVTSSTTRNVVVNRRGVSSTTP